MVASSQSRLRLWRAFSEFFLDTEIQEYVFPYVVREIRASGLKLYEAESVLWNEVFPVLSSNFLSVAGVWSGWPDQWLLENIQPLEFSPPKKFWNRIAASEINRCWAIVADLYAKTQN